MVNTKINLCGIEIDNPIIPASGTFGFGAEFAEIYDINMFAINNRWPDITILLDIDPEVGLERIMKNRQGEVNRLDLEGLNFHNLVHQGYQIIKEKYSSRFTLIDGNETEEKVFENVYKVIKDKINEN